MAGSIRVWARAGIALVALAVAGCATSPEPIAASQQPWSSTPGEAWTHQQFPGKKPSEFQFTRKDGRDAVAVRSDRSASMLRQKLDMAPESLGRLRFSWNVPALMNEADLARRDSDDAPVRIVLAFDGDRSKLAPRDAMLSELARALTGEEMPYATLMYVWCNRREVGDVVVNARTSRIRKLVVESGAGNLQRWLEYERDVRADFERAFGEAPGRLIGVGIMTDSDNTQSRTQAWYGPVRLLGPQEGTRVVLHQPGQ